jgi:putative transposase
MLQMIGACRFVWNKMLALNLARLRRKQRVLHWVAMANLLPTMKRFWPWLSVDSYSQSLHQVCRRLADAFKRMFTKGTPHSGRKPRFKRRHQACSVRFPIAIKLEGNRIKIPKIGWVRFFKSRGVVGNVKNVTLLKEPTGWFVSIQAEQEIEKPSHPSVSEIGIDVGVVRFATFSDGVFVEPISAFKKMQNRLARAQRSLSRKVRFSSNWKKQRKIVSRIHSKIANTRKDFLHKLSTAISDSQAVVYVEDLKVSSMSRSAGGTIDSPGKNVRAKSGLNRSILDQGWSMFRDMLAYKLAWRGGKLVAVSPAYTSQRCPECGHVAKENRRSQAVFCCVECRHSANADHVGAINILRAGQALCGAMELSNA